MNRDQTLLELFTAQSAQVPIRIFLINLVLSAVLALILGRVYVRLGVSLSNREQFARNFLLLTMTTMVIITIVKSSLALSLGLVGALSIIRFRAAIKEPEELSYLFLAIGVGLGLGAEQTVVTLVAFAVVLAVLMLRHWVRKADEPPNLLLTFSCPSDRKPSVSQILEILSAHGSAARLNRLDESPDNIEAAFQVRFASIPQFEACNQRLKTLGEQVVVSWIENPGLVS